MLRVDILTLFPRMLDGFLSESILGRAIRKQLLEVKVYNIRDFAKDKHHTTDDRPFGGGPGMVLKPEPLWEAIDSLKTSATQVVYLCPDGEPFSPSIASNLARHEHIILISGHYEGIDQRVRDHCVHQELSIGDYVLTNGTLAAAVVLDASSRYIEGVLGEEKSLTQDSFTDNLLSFPQYTRPLSYRGHTVPEVLLSGNHPEIAAWRAKMQSIKTQSKRPDLLK
jgi:tRNA (guanine37-N1)-methyltransferase